MTMTRREMLIGGAALMTPPGGGLTAPARTEWLFDNLAVLGGEPVTVTGHPRLAPGSGGPAVLFDGVHDALVIDRHPLAGAKTFAFEALFRPDGGAFAQRWFHLESVDDPAMPAGTGTTRMLFEIRVTPAGWYLDGFMTGPGYKQALMVPDKVHPLGLWHHVAQTYDGRHYRSFVNGDLQMEVAMPFTAQGPGRCSIGARLNRVDYFRGAVRMAGFHRLS